MKKWAGIKIIQNRSDQKTIWERLVMNIKDDTRMSDNLLIVIAVAMQTAGVGDYLYRVEQPSIAMGKIPGVTIINVSTISPYFEVLCLKALEIDKNHTPTRTLMNNILNLNYAPVSNETLKPL